MADAVTVITTIAMQAVFGRLEPAFRQATGCGITLTFGPPSKAVELVRDGAPADIVMTTPAGIDELTAGGKIVEGSARVVANLIMGVAVRAGAPKPDISTAEKFKQAILDAESLVHANPASGSPSAAHFLKVADQLGIADAVRAKAILRSGIIARAVTAGEAELAIQQMAELMMDEGVEIVGPLPPELQNVVPLAAAILRDSAIPRGAQALIDLLATPEAKKIMERAGVLPPS